MCATHNALQRYGQVKCKTNHHIVASYNRPMNRANPHAIFATALVTQDMLDAAGVQTDATGGAAAQYLSEQVKTQLGEDRPDFVFAFFTPHFAAHAATLAAELRSALVPNVLLGCTAESVVTPDREIEHSAAISLIAARLPGATLTPFALRAQHLSEWATILSDAAQFADALGAPSDPKLFITLTDPFSTPIDAAGELGIGVLQTFNEFYPGIPVVGGVASGGSYPGSNVLLLNDFVAAAGIVGFAISGEVDIDIVVSQGCRPIGKIHTVTSARQNMVMGLDGEKPMQVVQSMVELLNDEDRHLLQSGGLYVGRAVRGASDIADTPGRGDFLIRGVLGADSRTGALMIGDTLEAGDLLQFHVRDARTAEEDLDLALAPQAFSDAPAGALLFTCNGRGTRLYDHPDGDVRILQRILADDVPVPLAGFFCGGEIGPIGGRNYLHGHTASLVLFRTPATDDAQS